MAVRKNADGSVTVGILPVEKENKPEEKQIAPPPARKKPATRQTRK